MTATPAFSAPSGLPDTLAMTDFCAERGIAPQIELIAADGVGEADERVEHGTVRYRFVIDVATMDSSA